MDFTKLESDEIEDFDENEAEKSAEVDIDEENVDLSPKIEELEKKLVSNPYDYESHVELIKTARKSGELDHLRAAREKMREFFPLSSKLWLEWIEDEKNFESDPEKIRSLFELSVKDYTSFDLWLEYVQWACGNNNDTDKIREIFERAVSSVGLNVAKGCLIWDAYREFESALLCLYSDKDEDQEPKNKQISVVLAIFKRQLSLPLIGIDDAYNDYLEFLNGKEVDKDIEKNYQLAQKQLEILKPYENRLKNSEPDSNTDDPLLKQRYLEAYNAYLDFECSHKNLSPVRIQALFERAITDFCLDEKLWIRYLTWLDRNMKIPEVTLDVYRRAVSNCSWVTKIWQNYLLAMERLQQDPQKLEELFNKAVEGAYYNTNYALEFRDFYLTRLFQIRRLVSRDSTEQPDYGKLRNAFETGESFLKMKFFQNWDSDFHYRQCWARIEAAILKDRAAFRKIFDQILTENNNGSRAEFWLEYFTIENLHFLNDRDLDYCRKLLSRATNSVSDRPESIFQQFLQFELENGQLSDYDQALQRIEQQRKRLKARYLEKDNQKSSPGQKFGSNLTPQKAKMSEKWQNKRKFQAEEQQTFVEPVEKRPRKEVRGQKVAENPQNLTTSMVGTSVSGGHVTISNKDPSVLPPPPGFKYNLGLEKNKLFVKNVHGAITEKDLEDFFKPYGNLVSIRLLMYKSGASKGLAYIEYGDEESADKALKATDGHNFHDKRIQVALSNPPPRRIPGFGGHPGAPRRPFSANKPQETTQEKPQPTFLMPRSVTSKPKLGVIRGTGARPQGTPTEASGADESSGSGSGTTNGIEHDNPKTAMSNEKFREMFLKK